MDSDPLARFHPAISGWFRESFTSPTPAQELGWPPISSGRHTLVLAPTGSGKTLAAFLWSIHELLTSRRIQTPGVHTLYISPLKALANDVRVNLLEPLAGIRARAEASQTDLPEVSVALRTGDTPPSERQRMLRHPPDILITTPESLHLLLTSPRAREMLRTVRTVIVDEIHSLCDNKRGSFLSLLLERLEDLSAGSPQRIGLSATQRPLALVGAYLAGQDGHGTPREIAIVDAGSRKDLDLRVLSPVEDFRVLPQSPEHGATIWPSIYELLLRLTEDHRSTLIFGNSRRVVERIAVEINRLAGYPLVKAHHGSVSREQRLVIERDLKAGRLPALVATSSLELGIDVGAIDLVCQVEAPFSVASGLQRIGRAGHLVRATSIGRMIPKTREDLLVIAAMARAMLSGSVSELRVPENPLDVLAQQIVAMVAAGPRSIQDLLAVAHRAYPYRSLTEHQFRHVIDLVSGRYDDRRLAGLRPRVSLDPHRDTLHPLPGTRHVAILNGGTIPDSGLYPMVLADGHTRLGELDEEFVFERRLGDSFTLGSSAWRILEITHDRVVVEPSEVQESQAPFWKAEGIGRDAEFGLYLGRFIREAAARLDSPGFRAWAEAECHLDEAASANLETYLRQQRASAALPTDRTMVVDRFLTQDGDERLAVLSPFGRTFHLALLLAVQAKLRRDGRPPIDAVYSNAGLLFRPADDQADVLLGILRALPAEDLVDLVESELERSPLFALYFRRNAARALLLPRARPGRRTPLWLQRLRSFDLLQVAAEHPGFPIVAETYRELTEDVLPLAPLAAFFAAMGHGEAELVVHRHRTPSPFAASLLLDFTTAYFYDEDRPSPAIDPAASLAAIRHLLTSSAHPETLLSEEAMSAVEARMQGTAVSFRARDGSELVELLRRIGDLSREELSARCEPGAIATLEALLADRRVTEVSFPNAAPEVRYVASEDAPRYRSTLGDDVRFIVERYLAAHAAVRESEILLRYPGAADLLTSAESPFVRIPSPDGAPFLADPRVFAQMRRLTLSKKRRAMRPVPAATYASSLLAMHRLSAPFDGPDALWRALDRLSGCSLPPSLWEPVLGARVESFRKADLDGLIQQGEVLWLGCGDTSASRLITLLPANLDRFAPLLEPPAPVVGEVEQQVIGFLARSGASFLQRISAAIDCPPSETAAALWSLSWGGRVTNDALAPALGAKPRPDAWTSGRSRRWGGGRWALVPELNVDRSDESIREALQILLQRCGLLCRETLALQAPRLRWAEAYGLLVRMEWTGDVERGVFVSGLSGPQFASHELVNALRTPPALKRPLLVSSLDPANVFGDAAPFPLIAPNGDRRPFRRQIGSWLVIDQGEPILAVETHGARLSPLVDLAAPRRRAALALLPTLVARPSGPKSIRVREWDRSPVSGSPIVEELEELGFMREDQSLTLYRSF